MEASSEAARYSESTRSHIPARDSNTFITLPRARANAKRVNSASGVTQQLGTHTQSERDGERKKKQTKERKGKEREGYREGERMVELIRCGETVAVCNYSVTTVAYLILSAQHGSTLLHDRHIKTEHRAH